MTATWRGDREVAAALAERFWSTRWDVESLADVGWRSLESQASWVVDLTEELLVLFPDGPPEQLNELVDVVAYSGAFLRGADLARRRGTRLRVVVPAVNERTVGHRTWPVPELRSEPEVAAWLELSLGQLLWLGDARGQQVRTGPGQLHTYEYHWVPRAGRVPRLLESPTPILKRVQRELVHRLLSTIPVHPAAHGFVAGRSVLTHARRHLGAERVLTVDLQDFFASVSRRRVAGILQSAGYPEQVAHTLTGLCCTQTPNHVLRRMPPGGSADARQALQGRLRMPHLPQGAPTSPLLANLVCFSLDRRLAGLGRAVQATYTRYADDLTFSGGAEFRLASADAVLRGIRRVVTDESFVVNPAKTRVQSRSERQIVTGVVVNERPNVTRRQYDQLRAVLHEARTRGPAAANREGHPDFRAHLTGRVEWVTSLNHGRGRRLLDDLAAVDWSR